MGEPKERRFFIAIPSGLHDGSVTSSAGSTTEEFLYASGDTTPSQQIVIRWDTSALPDNATITGATLSGLFVRSATSRESAMLSGDWYDFGSSADGGDYASSTSPAFVEPLSQLSLAPNFESISTFDLVDTTGIDPRGFSGIRLSVTDPAARAFITIASYEGVESRVPGLNKASLTIRYLDGSSSPNSAVCDSDCVASNMVPLQGPSLPVADSLTPDTVIGLVNGFSPPSTTAPDVFAATPGSVGGDPNSMRRDDNEYRVSSPRYPYTAVGRLRIYLGDTQTSRCTAFLISEDTIATNAHCVWDAGSNAPDGDTFDFVPSLNGEGPPTIDELCFSQLADVYVPQGYISPGIIERRDDYDYALIKLEDCVGTDNKLGTRAGWLGYTTDYSGSAEILQVGYPSVSHDGREMWQASGPIRDVRSKTYISHLYAEPGSSGSPNMLLTSQNCPLCISGLTSGRTDGITESVKMRPKMFHNFVKIGKAPVRAQFFSDS